MKRKTLVLFVVIAIVTLIATFGCTAAPAEQTPTAKVPIKIGGLFELTGGLASIGIERQNAATLALEQAGYKVAGQTVQFVAEDVGADPAVAMDKARKLVETDKVNIITGPIFSAAVNAVAPYYDKQGVPSVNPSGQLVEIPLTMKWIWLPITTMRLQGYAMGKYAYDVLGYKTATTIAQDYVAGTEYMGGFIDAFKEAGGTVVQEQWVPFGETDISTYFFVLKPADVLSMWLVGDSNIPGWNQSRELGVWKKMPVIQAAETGMAEPTVLAQIGDAVNGLISGTEYSRILDTPGNKEFVQAYEKRFGRPPGTFAGNDYFVMQIILEAIRNVGGDASPAKLAQALDKIDMDTIRGHISFSPWRTGITQAFIVKFEKAGTETTIKQMATYKVWLDKVGDKLVMHAERK